MKKFLFGLTLFLSVSLQFKSAYAQYMSYEPAAAPVKIENAWYKADVHYTNTRTYYENDYTFKVKVEYGKVTAISFGNGGSIHTGYNNEGYTYSGGSLTYKRDYSGNVTGISARILYSDSDGIKYYDILLQ